MQHGKLIQNDQSNQLMLLIVSILNDMIASDTDAQDDFCRTLREKFPERDPGDGIYPQFTLDLEENLIGLSDVNLPALIEGNDNLESLITDVTHSTIFVVNRTKNLHPVIITMFSVNKLKEMLGVLNQDSAFAILSDHDMENPQITFPAFYHYGKKCFVYICKGDDVVEFD